MITSLARRGRCALVFTVCSLFVAHVLAETETVDGVTYTYSVTNGVATIENNGAAAINTSMSGALNIPSSLGGYPVKSIGDHAFHECSGLTSVTIPGGVTSVGSYAFQGCSALVDVTISEGVRTIGTSVFGGCGRLTNLTFLGNAPAVTNLGNDDGSGCTVYVRRGSTGWGVDIPGMWNGMRIEYLPTPLAPPVVIGMDSFLNWEVRTVQKGQTIRIEYDSSELGLSNGEAFCVSVHYDGTSTNLITSTCPAIGSIEWNVPETVCDSEIYFKIATGADEWWSMYFNAIDHIPDGIYGWIGGNYCSGNWSDLSNWVVGQLPAEKLPGKDDVVIMTGGYYGGTVTDGDYEVGELRSSTVCALLGDGRLTVRRMVTTNENVYAYIGNAGFAVTDEIIGNWRFSSYDSKLGFPDGAIIEGGLDYRFVDPFITLIPTTNSVMATVVFTKGTLDVSERRFVVPEGWTLIREVLPDDSIRVTLGNQTAVNHNVVFDLGEYGTVTNGVLNQMVPGWAKAEEPLFRVADGWFFKGWDVDFSCVTEDMTIHAQYAAIPEIVKFEVSHRYPWNGIVDVEYEFIGDGIQPITEVHIRSDLGGAVAQEQEILSLKGDYSSAGVHRASWFNNSVTGVLDNCTFELSVSYNGKVLCATNICASLDLVQREEVRDIGSLAAIKPIKMCKEWAELPVPVWTNGTIRYVRSVGDDTSDGLSWSSSKASIQGAINTAENGDLILVDGGTYAPITDGRGKSLTILGVHGSELTTIDGGGTARCADLSNGAITLQGFTLRNGYYGGNGGGAACGGTLIDCIVRDSKANYGGGTYNTVVWSSVFYGNTASDDGSGAWGGRFYDCTFYGNCANNGGGWNAGAVCRATLYNCIVSNNIAFVDGAAGIDNSTAYGCICSGNYRGDTGVEANYYSTTIKTLEEGGAYAKPIDETGLTDGWLGSLEGMALLVNGDVYATTSNDEATVKWTPSKARLWTLELAPIRDGRVAKPIDTALFDCSAMEGLVPATNLVLTAVTTTMCENVSSGVRIFVKRVGGDHEDMTIGLTADVEGIVSFPETVTIPAGSRSAMFYATPVDDSVANGKRRVRITAEATNFLSAEIELVILDDELPKLALELDKTSIREGNGAIIATVTREIATEEDTVVYLSGASTSRCSYPLFVIIPAGERSVSFEISVKDNDMAEIAVDLTLRASAAGSVSASASYRVEDDDVPGVTLSLTPEVVSEGAGAQAIYATLTRSDTNQIAQTVRVRLAASESDQLILPSEITIPKYTMAVRFAIGVIDNVLNDGDREVTINGAVVIEACGCSGQPSNGDVIQAVVGIVDNDGPALALKADPATMREGLDPAGYLILSHNSTLAEDLTVRLWADMGNGQANAAADVEIEIPETVTIPAGETSVRIPVKTLDDGVEDGGQLVSVYVQDAANVFAPASTWIQVSDQNLPDLAVASAEAVSSVVAKESFAVSFAVTNIGFMAASRAIPYAVHLVKGSAGAVSSETLVKGGTLTGGLEVGAAVYGTVSLTAPELPGDYRVAVVLDPDGMMSELDKANNIGWSPALSVGAAYTAMVQVEGDVYKKGEHVVMSGSATRVDGTPASNVLVEIYILNGAYRRAYSTYTDAKGNFVFSFEPVVGEAGHYRVGVSYPGMASSVAMDEFDILGLERTESDVVKFDMVVGDTATKTVAIKNVSAASLSGAVVEISSVPPEFTATVDMTETIPGSGTGLVTITAEAVSACPKDLEFYRKATVAVSTVEGAAMEFPVYFYSKEAEKDIELEFTPASLSANMAIGEVRYVEAVLKNTGKEESGRVVVNVPEADWLRLASSDTIESIPAGGTSVVVLELSPSDRLTLNAPITGSLSARDGNGATARLGISFTPVASSTGAMKIMPCDEYTYYQSSSPHVTGAVVTVSNPYTGSIVTTGITGHDGMWMSPQLSAGVYTVKVSAAQHGSWVGNLSVEPGEVSVAEPFITFNSISYTWTVKRTEVADDYSVVLKTDFVTSVPKPTLEIVVPKSIPQLSAGESHVFTVTIQNHGLIAAQNVQLSFGEDFPYSYEVMVGNVETIAAKSSVDVPVRVYAPEKVKKLRASTLDPTSRQASLCMYGMLAMFEYLCGPSIKADIARSDNIMISGLICDTVALLAEAIGPTMEVRGNGSGDIRIPSSGGEGGIMDCDRLSEMEGIDASQQLEDCRYGIGRIDDVLGNVFDLRPMLKHVTQILKALYYPQSKVRTSSRLSVEESDVGAIDTFFRDVFNEFEDSPYWTADMPPLKDVDLNDAALLDAYYDSFNAGTALPFIVEDDLKDDVYIASVYMHSLILWNKRVLHELGDSAFWTTDASVHYFEALVRAVLLRASEREGLASGQLPLLSETDRDVLYRYQPEIRFPVTMRVAA